MPSRYARSTALIAIFAATACATTGRTESVATVTPATAHEHQPVAAAAADTGRLRYTAADVAFMQHMIHHHAQALVMTRMAPTRTQRREVRLLAERIEVSQLDEITLMQQWLRERGEQVPAVEGGGHPHGGADAHAGMPGMASPEQLAQLAASRGTEFDRLFLDLMIPHHEGALVMVAELFASPGAAQEPHIFQLASDVDADQRMEIERMRRVRSSLPGASDTGRSDP